MPVKKKVTQKRVTRSKPKARITTKQKQQRRKQVRRYFILFTLMLCIGSFLYLLQLSQLRIGRVTVETQSLINSNEVEQKIQKELEGYYVYVFPKNSIFWYDKDTIGEILRNDYPEIDSLEVDLKKFDDLQINITEREVQYQASFGQELYDLDMNGVLFKKTSSAASSTRIFYSQLDAVSGVLGEQFVERDTYIEFNGFLDDLEKQGIVVKKIYFENKIQTILELDNSVRLIIHPSDKYETIVKTLQEVLVYKEFGFDKIDSDFAVDVAYINLRYGNKLFYCYSEDVCRNNYQIK